MLIQKSFLSVLFFLAVAGSALAAQTAQITIDQAELRQGPMKGSAIVGHLKKGDKVAVSNYPVQNFYKARSPSGQVGWVSAEQIKLSSGIAPVSTVITLPSPSPSPSSAAAPPSFLPPVKIEMHKP